MTDTNQPRNEIYELALHAAPSGIMVVGENSEIQYANQTLADMFGHSVQDLIGQPVEILLHEDFAASHKKHVKNYSHKPESREMGAGRDLEGKAKDGRRFPVEIGLRPAQTRGGKVVVATVIDITQRKEIEARLRQHEEQLEELVEERTQELLEAQREKERVMEHLIQAEKMTAMGTLVSGIGHEINNPLYVLFAAAEALVDEQDISNCRDYGEEILKQAKNIKETVKSLSLYSQPGTRHDEQRVDLGKSIDEAIHLAQRTLHGNEVEFKVTPFPLIEIMAKSEEIQQVLFNIVRNAVQAIGGKGRVDISVLLEGNWVSVSIQDNGAGISPEDLKRVFDPFFTTKGPDEGEGLGLYIVRQIVLRYRGTIEANNAEGGGTRFDLRFPIAD